MPLATENFTAIEVRVWGETAFVYHPKNENMCEENSGCVLANQNQMFLPVLKQGNPWLSSSRIPYDLLFCSRVAAWYQAFCWLEGFDQHVVLVH